MERITITLYKALVKPHHLAGPQFLQMVNVGAELDQWFENIWIRVSFRSDEGYTFSPRPRKK